MKKRDGNETHRLQLSVVSVHTQLCGHTRIYIFSKTKCLQRSSSFFLELSKEKNVEDREILVLNKMTEHTRRIVSKDFSTPLFRHHLFITLAGNPAPSPCFLYARKRRERFFSVGYIYINTYIHRRTYTPQSFTTFFKIYTLLSRRQFPVLIRARIYVVLCV